MKESTKARSLRQKLELSVFVETLRKAGNIVETELRFDARPKDSTARPKVPRLWRWDVALPACAIGRDVMAPHNVLVRRIEKIAIEVQGFGQGHQGTRDMKDEIEKFSEGFAQGWWILVVTWKMIGNGQALDVLSRAGVAVEKEGK
jgi:hypothetical protein